MVAFSVSPVCVPLTKIAVRGSSTSFGSRASIARLERAFLGFLIEKISPGITWKVVSAYTVRSIVVMEVVKKLKPNRDLMGPSASSTHI